MDAWSRSCENRNSSPGITDQFISASLAVIKGRRRIGKSRLAEEFGKQLQTYTFIGLPPDKSITPQHQREEFARQMQEQLIS
ncbi:MAG: hypothetical protein ACHQUC_07460 [Chlamydiales bacterium]